MALPSIRVVTDLSKPPPPPKLLLQPIATPIAPAAVAETKAPTVVVVVEKTSESKAPAVIVALPIARPIAEVLGSSQEPSPIAAPIAAAATKKELPRVRPIAEVLGQRIVPAAAAAEKQIAASNNSIHAEANVGSGALFIISGHRPYRSSSHNHHNGRRHISSDQQATTTSSLEARIQTLKAERRRIDREIAELQGVREDRDVQAVADAMLESARPRPATIPARTTPSSRLNFFEKNATT